MILLMLTLMFLMSMLYSYVGRCHFNWGMHESFFKEFIILLPEGTWTHPRGTDSKREKEKAPHWGTVMS